MRLTLRRLAKRSLALAALFGLSVAVGCISNDRHVFNSSYHDPATIAILDLETKAELWSKPIPPGSRLIIDFDRDGHDNMFITTGIPADALSYQLYKPNAGMAIYGYPHAAPVESGKVKLPGSPIILVYQLASEGRGVYSPTKPAITGPATPSGEGSPYGPVGEQPAPATTTTPEAAEQEMEVMEPAPAEPVTPAPAPAPTDPATDLESAVEPPPPAPTPAPPTTAEPEMIK